MAQLRFFGTAGYELVTDGGQRVVMDPYMDSNPACPLSWQDLETDISNCK